MTVGVWCIVREEQAMVTPLTEKFSGIMFSDQLLHLFAYLQNRQLLQDHKNVIIPVVTYFFHTMVEVSDNRHCLLWTLHQLDQMEIRR